MPTNTFTGTGFSSDPTKWSLGHMPLETEDVVIAGFCTQDDDLVGITCTINAGFWLDTPAYDVTLTGLMDILATGKHIMGATSNLTCVGWVVHAADAADLQPLSLINSSGNVTNQNTASFVNNRTGQLILAASLIFDWRAGQNLLWKFKSDPGTVITGATSSLLYVTDEDCKAFEHLGTSFSCSNQVLIVGCNATGIFTLGNDATSGDFLNADNITFRIRIGATVTVNRTSAFSVSGGISFVRISTTGAVVLTGNWENTSSFTIGSNTNQDGLWEIMAGILRCQKLVIRNTLNGDQTVDCSVNNPSFDILGDVEFNNGGGGGVRTWIKGTGNITLRGPSNTVDFNGQDIESTIIDTPANITVVGDFKPTNLDVKGTLKLDPTKTNQTGNITGDGTLESITGVTVFLHYSGTETFTGTLINVVLVGPFGQNNFNLDPTEYPKAGNYTIERLT